MYKYAKFLTSTGPRQQTDISFALVNVIYYVRIILHCVLWLSHCYDAQGLIARETCYVYEYCAVEWRI